MAAAHDEEQHDWAAQLAGHLERIVERLRDLSVKPALGLVRGLIIATVGLIVGTLILVALVIAVTKLFDADVFNGRVWATDFLFGGMLMLSGAFIMRLGARRKDSSHG